MKWKAIQIQETAYSNLMQMYWAEYLVCLHCLNLLRNTQRLIVELKTRDFCRGLVFCLWLSSKHCHRSFRTLADIFYCCSYGRQLVIRRQSFSKAKTEGVTSIHWLAAPEISSSCSRNLAWNLLNRPYWDLDISFRLFKWSNLILLRHCCLC